MPSGNLRSLYCLQVHISYGSHSNQLLLKYHGFTIPDSPEEAVTLYLLDTEVGQWTIGQKKRREQIAAPLCWRITRSQLWRMKLWCLSYHTASPPPFPKLHNTAVAGLHAIAADSCGRQYKLGSMQQPAPKIRATEGPWSNSKLWADHHSSRQARGCTLHV